MLRRLDRCHSNTDQGILPRLYRLTDDIINMAVGHKIGGMLVVADKETAMGPRLVKKRQ